MADLTRLLRGAHPFLSEPGEWIVAGHSLHGETLQKIPVQGTTRVVHDEGKIVNEGVMTIMSASEPVTFGTRYEIAPTDDYQVFRFFQANPEVGDLTGTMVAMDDRLISSYSSGQGSLVGLEVLHRLGDYRYAVTGGLTSAGRLVSLWKFDMVRPAAPDAGRGPGEPAAG